jgi:hypothetical protein
MEKTLRLALSKYPVTPHTLRTNPSVNEAKSEISVSLASLFHHYYLDTYGRRPPHPDPAQFEHVRFLLPGSEFRFQGTGLGASTSARRSRSCELGQAFCRWFLHDHLNITYFANIGDLINRQLHRAFGGCSIQRIETGDTPDYFCAESVDRVFLAEAKGRYTSIGFGTKEFNTWRKQFDRVRVLDAAGIERSVKGHIVATRFAAESDTGLVRTTLLAEDPQSPGARPLEGEPSRSLGTAVLGLHYGGIAEKLDQPLLAAALINGIALPEQVLIQVARWHLAIDTVQGRTFVGGYYSDPSVGGMPFEIEDGKIYSRRNNPFCLDAPKATFFGVEENIFREIVSVCRSTGQFSEQMQQLSNIAPAYSAISMLRDGSVVGPAELFVPIGTATL